MQRPRVDEQHAPLERAGLAAAQAFAPAQVDEERVGGRRLERQAQRRAPVVEFAPDEFHLPRGQAAGVHQLQHQRAQVFVLDRRRIAVAERDELPLDPLAAGVRHQAVQLGPLRGNPLLVAEQPHARVEREMHDLPAQQLWKQLLPAPALRAIGDFARK